MREETLSETRRNYIGGQPKGQGPDEVWVVEVGNFENEEWNFFGLYDKSLTKEQVLQIAIRYQCDGELEHNEWNDPSMYDINLVTVRTR
jgi:hypothetical protein